MEWNDSNGNLWIFGGQKASTSSRYLADIWLIETNNSEVIATWISGTSELDYYDIETPEG